VYAGFLRCDFEKPFYTTCGFVEVCAGESKGSVRKSVIYFLVALILLPLGLAFVPRVSSQSQAPDVKILSYNYYIDSAGFFDVVGEVKNVGSTTLTSVIIAGSVYSGVIDVGDTYAPIGVEPVLANYLLPQQQAPFYMTFYAPNSQTGVQTWSSIDITNVSLSVVQASATSSYPYPDLEVTGVTTSIGTGSNAGAYFVNGYIQNTGTQTAQNITVLGTFYDSKGDTVGVGNSNTTASLSPSAKAPFILPAWDINDSALGTHKITSYSFLILVQDPIYNSSLQGAPPTVTPYPNAGLSSSTPVSSPTSSPAPSSSSSPTSSSSLGGKTNSSNLFNPTLIAIIAVVAVVAVVGAAVGLRKNKQPHISTKEKIKPKRSEPTNEPIKPKPKSKPKPSELTRERRVQSKPRESTKEKIKRRRRENS
jgi:hypothetical protein